MRGIPTFTPTFASPNLKDPSKSYADSFNAYAQTTSSMIGTGFDQVNQMLFERQQQNRQLQGAYGQLNRAVQRRLAGSNRANLQDIADQYTAMSGQMSQSMIDRGLGNSTVQDAMQIGLGASHAKERTRSENMFAQLQADYMAKIRGAGLQARERGMDATTSIRQAGLGFLSSMTPAPPDPGTYFAMSQALGQGQMPGQLPSGPGASPPQGPTGGHIPAGLFAPSYGVEGGGGGGGVGDPSFYMGAGVGNNPWGGYYQQVAANQVSGGVQPGLGAVAGGLSYLNNPV